MSITLHTLKNGLRVLLIDTKAFSSVTTLLLVAAGSRYENHKNNGIAHFFEHMAFKGSKKYPSSMVIASTIESFGGIFNAFTGKDQTGYWIKAPVEHFETCLYVLSDMIQNSLLKQEEIEREKGVIVEEINLYEDTPYKRVADLYESLVYKNNPLGFFISGTKDTITKFTRKTFVDYMSSLYHPNNAVLVVAGGLSQAASRKPQAANYLNLIKEKFSKWGRGQSSKYKKVKINQKKPQIKIHYKKTEQAHLCIGFRAYARSDPRRYALSVLSTILGGGMSSRLFYEIRERRGLCYYIQTSQDLYQDAGSMVTQAGVGTDVSSAKKAIELILKEHKDIASGRVKKDELERAKELIKGRLILSFEDSAKLANFFGKELLLEKKLYTLKDILQKIDKVVLDDIVNTAFDIVKSSKLNIVIIGPFSNLAGSLRRVAAV